MCLQGFPGNIECHRHVLGCRFNGAGDRPRVVRERDFFVDRRTVLEANRQLRLQKLRRFLMTIKLERRVDLVESLRAELNDVDINVEEALEEAAEERVEAVRNQIAVLREDNSALLNVACVGVGFWLYYWWQHRQAKAENKRLVGTIIRLQANGRSRQLDEGFCTIS